MKTKKYLFPIFLLFLIIGCNESEILKEEPLDFFSPSNSFQTPKDIHSAINWNIARTKLLLGTTDGTGWEQLSGTDLFQAGVNPGTAFMDDYVTGLDPTGSYPLFKWNQCYLNISYSNVIIGKVANIIYPSDAAKNAHIAVAKFLRAWNYRLLVAYYGGVPLVLEETTSVKRDFVRATKEQVYDQIIQDAEFASKNLPNVKSVRDGEICSAAADHLLAEIYLTKGRFSDAIAAASRIIDGGDFQLMTLRFGASAKDTPGDPYYDLFEMGNQNRSTGNREVIWALQMEADNSGEAGVGVYFERNFGPWYWGLTDPKGVAGFIGPTTQNGGRGVGFFRPTPYLRSQIWLSDWNNDLRNSSYNMIRDYVYDNPKSLYYGKKVTEFIPQNLDSLRKFYVCPRKISTRGKHPAKFIQIPATGLLFSSAMANWNDWYLMRLAETYLIRAEAYLQSGDKQKAADDINAVRRRANATPVTPSMVDIDYILDERARELGLEEFRRITLSRLGLVYDRVRKYAPVASKSIQPYNALFPIPYSEIEKNVLGKLEQNPGYK